MGAADRAYTSEYSYLGQAYEPKEAYAQRLPYSSAAYGQAAQHPYAYPEFYPTRAPEAPRVKRTKEKGAQSAAEQARQKRSSAILTRELLIRFLLLLSFAGVLLIGTIWMSARAAQVQYEINKLDSANAVLQNEITMLDIKIESANSIEQIEEYATESLKMQYPKDQQCVCLDIGSEGSQGLILRIREKAYGE